MLGATMPPCDAGVIRATPTFPAGLSQQRKRLTLAATILGSSMAFIDGSVVNIALPAIQQALRADAVMTQWIVNAYLLLLGALVLVGGAAADLYGRRRIFLIGIALFTISSIGCGLAPNITLLIVCRAVQGIGAAVLTPASLAMLGATFDEQERSKAIGLWAGFGALTSAAGPVLGGWLVDHVSWRAIFLLNVPLAVIATGLATAFACESRDPQARALDWRGATAIAVSLSSITWGFGAIPKFGFRDVYVLGALGGGTALFFVFVAIEARARAGAMMPLSLYRSREFSGTNALTLLLYFALSGALYFLPFGLIRLGGYSATQAGAALLPFALIMGSSASLAGGLADRFGPRLSLTMGPIIAACGLALLGLVDLAGSYWAGAFPAICILALGMTVTVPPLTSTVMTSAGDAHAGVASGVNNAVARVAGLLAVAALGAVLSASFSNHLSGIPPAQANDALNAVMAGHVSSSKDGLAAFDGALRTVMWTASICAGLGGCIGWISIRRTDVARSSRPL
ncbi:MFS transporter [Bradyrhizobium erythrophlei]|uniref:MFS transporter n=1 Tax=Bradyrhizobium erythrophlei TaxID=1437360 RepID=UPI0035EA8796